LTGDWTGNIRVFEACAAGACLVTEHRENISDFFDADSEVVTYHTLEEAAEKINYLARNPSITSQIAQAGQKRALSEHTTVQRAQVYNEIFLKLLHN